MPHLLKPPRTAKACANCIHFAPTGTAFVSRLVGGHYRGVIEKVRGDCRIKPPQRDKKTGDALWPDVVGSDWCGAFARPQAAQRLGATFDEPYSSSGGAS